MQFFQQLKALGVKTSDASSQNSHAVVKRQAQKSTCRNQHHRSKNQRDKMHDLVWHKDWSIRTQCIFKLSVRHPDIRPHLTGCHGE